MLAFALLFPALAFAGPLAGRAAEAPSVKRGAEPAFFAPSPPGSPPSLFCEAPSYKLSKDKVRVPWGAWLAIRDWARANNGQWDLTRTTTTTYGDWNILHRVNDTYIAVQSSQITAVGNQDVADLIDRIHNDLRTDENGNAEYYSFDEDGSFGNCIGGVHVGFYLKTEFHLGG
ncbi:hypothetical protein F5Y04DRAFT_90670 [Hypomontagnella monticulosa]|nr:hypothetical protein F5Y04DRAFT_90670 [Hypomontagnella monticulosa]